MNSPIIIAHRGASAYAPENTMSAFEKALEMGVGGIELDVHLTKDGHIVVIHDEKVDRTSNGSGWVKDMTLDELKQLDFGSWFDKKFKDQRIPTLEQVMELLSGWDGLLNIEIKSDVVIYQGIEQKLIDLVEKYNMVSKVIMASFNHYCLLEVQRISPEMKIGLLYVAGLITPWEYAQKLKADALHPLHYSVTPEMIENCKEYGIEVNPYTVNEPEHIKKVALAGVDGIITDVPDIASQILGDLKK